MALLTKPKPATLDDPMDYPPLREALEKRAELSAKLQTVRAEITRLSRLLHEKRINRQAQRVAELLSTDDGERAKAQQAARVTLPGLRDEESAIEKAIEQHELHVRKCESEAARLFRAGKVPEYSELVQDFDEAFELVIAAAYRLYDFEDDMLRSHRVEMVAPLLSARAAFLYLDGQSTAESPRDVIVGRILAWRREQKANGYLK